MKLLYYLFLELLQRDNLKLRANDFVECRFVGISKDMAR